MPDNKNVRDGRDRSKIDINDPSEVEYVHQQFPAMTHQQIVEAIRSKGPNRVDVMKYLQSMHGKN